MYMLLFSLVFLTNCYILNVFILILILMQDINDELKKYYLEKKRKGNIFMHIIFLLRKAHL